MHADSVPQHMCSWYLARTSTNQPELHTTSPHSQWPFLWASFTRLPPSLCTRDLPHVASVPPTHIHNVTTSSPPPGLGWVPPQLLTHVRALLGFLRACWELLPEFVAPSVPEALRRLVLVLAASLAMVVVVSTIDSGWLWLYLLRARRGVVAV